MKLNRRKVFDPNGIDIVKAWPVIERVWGWAAGVYRTRVGARARRPVELTLLQELVKAGRSSEKLFASHLLHEKPYVAAYCLLGLAELKSPVAASPPHELLLRTEPIRVHVGCFAKEQSLGDFAGKLQQAALQEQRSELQQKHSGGLPDRERPV